MGERGSGGAEGRRQEAGGREQGSKGAWERGGKRRIGVLSAESLGPTGDQRRNGWTGKQRLGERFGQLTKGGP